MQDEVFYNEKLLEQVKSKRRRVYPEEKISEVIITQCIICVLLILIFVVMNIFAQKLVNPCYRNIRNILVQKWIEYWLMQ